MKKEWAYHQWSISDLEKSFDIKTDKGLSKEKVPLLLAEYGKNSLDRLENVSFVEILLKQFKNFFVLLLFVAAVISYFTENIIQSGIILLIIVINIFLGFIQEYKAEKALSALKKSYSSKCKAIRSGKIELISNEDLVPGDIVVVEAGDAIPADLRLFESHSLQVDESALTGESLPIYKEIDILPVETLLADRKNMAYASSHVVSGVGRGIVVATGERTEFGKIADLVSDPEKQTPLEKQTLFLGKTFSFIAILAGLTILVVGLFRNYEVLPLLTYIVSMVVSVVPESLPTVITLTLAVGVSRMLSKKAIVRKMSAIESLGTINIIATDKTGTLTNNKLTLEKIFTWNEQNLLKESRSNEIEDILHTAILASDIDLNNKQFIGDPLDVAIVEKSVKSNLSIIVSARLFVKEMKIPFDANNKYAGSISQKKKEKILAVKGSTEKIVEFCKLSKSEKESIIDASVKACSEGYRVIAIAKKELDKNAVGTISGMNFLGLLAFTDELAIGVKESMKKLQEANIRTIILTGDHPETAKSIAQKAGISVSDDEIISGSELGSLNKRELKKRLDSVKIFARVTPEDKTNIVNHLESEGFSVAVTGDGVNDAPALMQSTVGIAMGVRGTDVAKNASSIILSDDRYSTIISAIEYGRSIFDNIQNSIIFLLAGNLSMLMIVLVSFIFNLPLPLSPLQILWINVIIESFLAISMSFELPTAKVLREKPRSTKTADLQRSVFYSAIIALICFSFSMHIFMTTLNHGLDYAQTSLFTFIVFFSIALSLSIRSKERIWENPFNFIKNHYLILGITMTLALQFFILQSSLGKIFNIVSISLSDGLKLAVLALIIFLITEVVRGLCDRYKKS